eukprot:31032-Pelagococcus_subviridis.AAC.33
MSYATPRGTCSIVTASTWTASRSRMSTCPRLPLRAKHSPAACVVAVITHSSAFGCVPPRRLFNAFVPNPSPALTSGDNTLCPTTLPPPLNSA